jgi:hypothetical protein
METTTESGGLVGHLACWWCVGPRVKSRNEKRLGLLPIGALRWLGQAMTQLA